MDNQSSGSLDDATAEEWDALRVHSHPGDFEQVEDAINPSHYLQGGIECIDYLKAKLSTQEYKGYLRGNAIKYLTRYDKKGGVEDLIKAEWYLGRLINQEESECQ